MEDFTWKTEEFNVHVMRYIYKQARRVEIQNPTHWNVIW